MERATLKGASGLGVGFGGRRGVTDTLSQRPLRESSSRSHSRPRSHPDPDVEQDDREDDKDETRRFQRLLSPVGISGRTLLLPLSLPPPPEQYVDVDALLFQLG